MKPPPVPKWLPQWLLLVAAALFLVGVTSFEGTVVAMLTLLSVMVAQR